MLICFMVKKNLFKYFIAYEDHDYIGPVCIKLPQMIGFVQCFDSNKTFRVTDNNLLKNIQKYGEK